MSCNETVSCIFNLIFINDKHTSSIYSNIVLNTGILLQYSACVYSTHVTMMHTYVYICLLAFVLDSAW
jgi:hypothetical protein